MNNRVLEVWQPNLNSLTATQIFQAGTTDPPAYGEYENQDAIIQEKRKTTRVEDKDEQN